MPHLPASDFLDGTLQLLGLPEALESIAGHAATASGRRAVREASPGMGEAERVERRQRGEELLVIQETVPLPEAAACPDLLHIVSKATQHALDGVELAGIQKCLNRFQEWAHWALHRGSAEHLSELLQGASDLSSLQELLRLTVDLRGEVLDTADPSLGPLRLEIRTLDQKRRKHIEQTAAEWGAKGHLENPRPVMRGGRPTLAVKAAHSGRTPGILHDRSNRGDTVYVEPSGVVELSNRLTKKTSAEKALVQRILSECTRTVVRRRADLEELDQIMGEADLGFASARWASEVQARFPTMTSEALVLREARHPGLIQSLGHAAVVPLDLELGKEFHLLVVTGPNTGGKTVVLKTVGLLASCACAGFPIPAAEGTNIPSIPCIGADIGDAQSLTSSLSTFSGHLQRIQIILDQAKPGMLVLLDELGTGTDPEEGAALGQAILEVLLEKGAWVIANTHLGSLKMFSVQVAGAENASMEFDPVSLTPSYRLLVGVPGASHALEVARILGLSQPILERASSLADREGAGEELLAQASGIRRDAENMRSRARNAEAHAREVLRSAQENEGASRMRAEIREQEAEQAFRDLRSRVERLIEDKAVPLLDRLSGHEKQSLESCLGQMRMVFKESDLMARWQQFLKSLKKGEVVWVPAYRERMRIQKVDRKRERVQLWHGQLALDLPFHELSWVDPPPPEDPTP